MKRTLWSCFALLLAFPAMAMAADGYVTGNVNLRAGPDVQYPALTVLPAGTPVAIQGCTQDWEWCDVIASDDRGWVAGNFIQYDYDNQAVLLPAYGARIGIPIVTFVISTYWDNYYRNQPFYRERTRWYSRPVPRRPPPPPLHRPLRPIHAAPPRRPAAPRPPANRPPMPQRPTNDRGQPGHHAPASRPAQAVPPQPRPMPSRPMPSAPPQPRPAPPAGGRQEQRAQPAQHAAPRPAQGHAAAAPKRKDHGHDSGG